MADRESGKGDLAGSAWGGKEDLETPALALLRRPEKDMTYVSLHHHSTFSFLDGFGLPKSHIHRAAELGMPALALTEHGNVSSHARLAKAAKDYGVHPIFGCELYCGAVGDDRVQRKNHLTVLASNAVGYRNLLACVSQGWEDFYYEPTVSGANLAKHKEGLIVLSGCTGSLLATSLVGGKNVDPSDASYGRGKKVARRFKSVFGDAYYLEVQAFPELENVRQINKMLERIGRELKIPLVASGDCHYTRPEESELQQILHAVGRHKSLEQLAQNWGYDVPLAHALSDTSVYERLRGTGLSQGAAIEAIANTAEIAGRCQVTLPHMDPIRFPIPDGQTRESLWRDWIKKGWHFRNFGRKKGDDLRRYRERLLYEMSVIEEKDFVDYFLFTADIVQWSKDNGILVGPGRGSAAASLVCYLLRITEVDPLRFDGLIFERFIDLNRADLPDIDLDFDDERRHEVFEYAERKYGAPYVGRIGSLVNFKSKNSLDDVGKVFHVPPWEIDKIKEVLIERSSGDLRASGTVEDTIASFDQASDVVERFPDLLKAMALEGNVKGLGLHSAGLVVASRPLREVCAVYSRVDSAGKVKVDEWGNPMKVISYDKYDSEEYGLLKMDILGLSNMGMLARVMRFTGMTVQDFYDLPLDDEKVINGFRTNDCIGIFQFDGWAMRSVNASLKPDKFSEIADVNALARPGPLHSGANENYIAIKRGQAGRILSHPLLDPIVAHTHGQIIYQEQILRIVREIGKFDWTHAGYIRRIISRKIGEQEFQRQFEKFRDGARENGLDDDLINNIWGQCITAGAYAFNAAHSVSYGMIAYWTMWVKVHHPEAFYAAALGKMPSKGMAIMRDAEVHGIRVLPPDLNDSEVSWKPWAGGGAVLPGFSQIPGIGQKTAQAIVDYRDSLPHGLFESWNDLCNVKGIGPKTVDKIMEFVGAEDPFEIYALQKKIEKVKDCIRRRAPGFRGIPFPTHETVDVPSEKGRDTEVVWAGTVHSRNVRDLFEINSSKGEALDPETIRDPHLREWVIMYVEDHTDQMSVKVNRWRYPDFKKAVFSINLDSDVVIIRGVKKGFQNRRTIEITQMWVVDPDD
jgi:DNA polymerase-3 subunit alpha